MPRNPSEKQIAASRKNLRGKEGPKTPEGKIISAQNGRLNKGVKTAKARARVLAGRWKRGTDSFYAYADCFDCQETCTHRTFSAKTPFQNMPMRCLERVLREQPERCFYYFEGVCCTMFNNKFDGAIGSNSCILETNFLEIYRSMPNQKESDLARLELNNRLKNLSLKKEMMRYWPIIRHYGPKRMNWTPRMKYVVRYFRRAIRLRNFCVLESNWRSTHELDETLEWLAESH